MLLLRIRHRIEQIDVTLYLPINFVQFLISIRGRSRQYNCNMAATYVSVLCDMKQLKGSRGRGLSAILESKYSQKSVDLYIYEYINNRVNYNWYQSRGIFQPT